MIHIINPSHIVQLNAAGMMACFLLSKIHNCKNIAVLIRMYLLSDTPPPGRASGRIIRMPIPDNQSGIFLSYEWWCYHFVKT